MSNEDNPKLPCYPEALFEVSPEEQREIFDPMNIYALKDDDKKAMTEDGVPSEITLRKLHCRLRLKVIQIWILYDALRNNQEIIDKLKSGDTQDIVYIHFVSVLDRLGKILQAGNIQHETLIKPII